MTPTDELIAALRKAAQAIHIAVEKSVADDISQKLTEAADRLASLTAPLGGTDLPMRRSYVEGSANDNGDPSFKPDPNGPYVLWDDAKAYLDRALASLSAERDQNKRLAEVLKEALRDLENDCPHSAESSIRAVIPQEPQPEEQR